MLQARKLGKELLVGIHSDEDILENKGPTVMTLAERSVYPCAQMPSHIADNRAIAEWLLSMHADGPPARSPMRRT